MTRRRTYLIQDPYDHDALEFIRATERYFGLRPVCMYTDPRARFDGEQRFPELTSTMIESSVDVDLSDLASFAADIGERYDVVAVVPYREDLVEPAADMCELLDLPWVAPDTLRLFRDKAGMRSHLRAVAPDIRIPEHRLVTTGQELRDGPLPERFVVKPNDGLGNLSIGIFGSDQVDDAVAHVESEPSRTWIIDEFIGGTEYHINGQVRTGGEVTTLAVIEYLRMEVNGYQTVYAGEIQVHSDEPVFAQASDYASRLLQATGLERCPFHIEVKIDEHGPCAIDIAARLGSDGVSKTVSRLHPERPDVFAVAAHDYLGPNDFATSPVDWTHHDRHRTVYAYGISAQTGLIESLSGLEDVEARADFARWVVKPTIGSELQVTRDLRGTPYIAELSIDGDADDARALIEEIQATIRWNADTDPRTAALVRANEFTQQAARKLRWLAHRTARLVPRPDMMAWRDGLA